jgi:nucleotide-binding universal stress UspA family protein
MQTRVAMRIGQFERAPPGMPAIATGQGCAGAAEWHLAHGAVQLLCVPPAAPLPNHVVIHTLDADARRATLAVAASLLRHVAAEAVYLGIQPPSSPETERAEHMRDLLDARSTALAEHGLDMRTELRPGDTAEQLQLELAAYGNSMLVLGTSDPTAIQWDWLRTLLEESPQHAVLIVNSARAETAVDG